MKKYILLLLMGFVGLVCFTNASYTFTSYCPDYCGTTFDVYTGNGFTGTFSLTNSYGEMSVTLEVYRYNNRNNITVTTSEINYDGTCESVGLNYNNCHYIKSIKFNNCVNGSSCNFIANYSDLGFNSSFSCPECESCPEVNTGEILSGYILESEIDTNYCVGNGLCPNECGSGTDLSGDLQFSNLYINDILHPGTPDIFVNIPDYITWDYTSDTGSFNLYVGSGYDMDYMNSIIKINSYRPDSGDFTNIFVSGLTLVFPYIAVLLLIVFIWKLLKRIFR